MASRKTLMDFKSIRMNACRIGKRRAAIVDRVPVVLLKPRVVVARRLIMVYLLASGIRPGRMNAFTNSADIGGAELWSPWIDSQNLGQSAMLSVDYYLLLKDGPENLTAGEWQEIVRSVSLYGPAAHDPDTALQTFQNLLFECTGEWVDTRRRIVSGASVKSSNPEMRSAYCLTSVRNLVAEACQEAERRSTSPESLLLHRQVADHLRKLRDGQVLNAFRIRTRKGRDICVLWALFMWGPDARQRVPPKPLEAVRSDLPIILAYRGGKGVFDYSSTLPSYIPMVLENYGATLSTSEITFTVIAKISPPLTTSVGQDDEGDILVWTNAPSPEELLESKQAWGNFVTGLDEREKEILSMKEDDRSIEEIAETLRCSKRTVNNLWKVVLDKAAGCFSVTAN
jgi:hypothetical protein